MCAQLADCLVAVIAQRLRFRPDLNIRVPECEILLPTNPVKAHVRNRDFFKIISALEIGGENGMWTFQRYSAWLEKRTTWYVPGQNPEAPDSEPDEAASDLPPLASPPKPPVQEQKTKPATFGQGRGGRIEIEPSEGDFGKILK